MRSTARCYQRQGPGRGGNASSGLVEHAVDLFREGPADAGNAPQLLDARCADPPHAAEVLQEIRLTAMREDLEEFLFTRLPRGEVVRQAV